MEILLPTELSLLSYGPLLTSRAFIKVLVPRKGPRGAQDERGAMERRHKGKGCRAPMEEGNEV
jgi:hypothetical protein